MSTITTEDGAEISSKDWGEGPAQLIVTVTKEGSP
jgi:hypothetical protein